SLGITRVFGSDFDRTGLANEGQVAPGDSGGGAFVNNRLVGLALYLGDERNGPYANSNPGSTDPNPPAGQPLTAAVFGNWSYYADLSSYVDQIATIAGLAPSMSGAANLDGIVDNAAFKIPYAKSAV